MTIDWKHFSDIIASYNTFLVTSHIRPDCDALGSALGMAMVLESLGKEVRIVTGDPVPPNLAFIDPNQRIETRSIGEISPTAIRANTAFRPQHNVVTISRR